MRQPGEVTESFEDLYREDENLFYTVMGGIPAVSGTVLEISGERSIIDASSVASNLYRREASSLPEEFGSTQSMENLEKIESVLEHGVSEAEGVRCYIRKVFSDYEVIEFLEEDRKLLMDARRKALRKSQRDEITSLPYRTQEEGEKGSYGEDIPRWR